MNDSAHDVEHIISRKGVSILLRRRAGRDCLFVRMDAGDPPLRASVLVNVKRHDVELYGSASGYWWLNAGPLLLDLSADEAAAIHAAFPFIPMRSDEPV